MATDQGAFVARALSGGRLDGVDGLVLVYPTPGGNPSGCTAFVAWRDREGCFSAREGAYSPLRPHAPQIDALVSGSALDMTEVAFSLMCKTLANVIAHADDAMTLNDLADCLALLRARRLPRDGRASYHRRDDAVDRMVRETAGANAVAARAFLAMVDQDALEAAVWLNSKDPGLVGGSRLVSDVQRYASSVDDLGRTLGVTPAFPYALWRAWTRELEAFEVPLSQGRSAVTCSDVAPLGSTRNTDRALTRMRGSLGPGLAGYAARWDGEVTDDFFTCPTTQWDPDAAGVEDGCLRIARLVGRLPPDWLPDDRAGWEAMIHCKPVLELGDAYRIGDHLSRWVNSGGDWARYHARLTKVCGAIGIEQMTSDIDDMIKSFSLQLLMPALRADDGTQTIWNDTLHAASVRVLASDRSAIRVLETSREWHERMHGIAAVERALPRPGQGTTSGTRHDRWDPGYPDWSCDGIDVVVLTSVGELVAEGGQGPDEDGMDGLSHCVGGYSVSCARNTCRIVSVRGRGADGTYRRLSTAELECWGGRIEVRQHRGIGNSVPPDAASSALALYVARLRTGELAVDEAALKPRTIDTMRSRHYDPGVPGSWEILRDAWAPMLPRPVRRMDRAAFRDAVLASLEADPASGWLPRSFGS